MSRAAHRLSHGRGAGLVVALVATIVFGSAPSPAWAEGPDSLIPVVLVHGLNSGPDTWVEYTRAGGFLDSISRQGFAVGDGQAPGVMDMGNWIQPIRETNTIAENAAVLDSYIDGVKARTGSARVDLVAHSMGGLVARYYIDRVMDDRDVARLVMLGTPNAGSDCASLPAALGVGTPATLELRPTYVTEVFNRSVNRRNGVPYFVLAGTDVTDPIRSPCAAVPSDGVVSQSSATTVDALAGGLPIGHVSLPASPEVFGEFVRPILTSEFDPRSFAAQPSRPRDADDAQFAAVAAARVPRGGRAEFVVQLDRVAVAAFALFDPSRSVRVEVRGAGGNRIDLDSRRHAVTIVDDPAAMVHLGYGFHNPRPGPWRVTVHASETTPAGGAGVAIAVQTQGGARVRAAASSLLGELGEPIKISAALDGSGGSIEVVDATAIVRRPDGRADEVSLAPDGSAAEGTWRPVTAGLHGIDVRLTGRDADGVAVERVALLTVEVQPPPAQIWASRMAAASVLGLIVAGVALLVRRALVRRARRRPATLHTGRS